MSQNDAPWRYETNCTLAIVQLDDQAVLVWRDKQKASFYLIEPDLSPAAIVGRRVRRGPDWEWGNQGGVGMAGTVTGVSRTDEGWVSVEWDNGHEFFYRWGADDRFDLQLEPELNQPPKQMAPGLQEIEHLKTPQEVYEWARAFKDTLLIAPHPEGRGHYLLRQEPESMTWVIVAYAIGSPLGILTMDEVHGRSQRNEGAI